MISVGRPQSIGEDPVNLAVNNRQSTVLKKEGQLGATKDSVTLDVGKPRSIFCGLWQDFRIPQASYLRDHQPPTFKRKWHRYGPNNSTKSPTKHSAP